MRGDMCHCSEHGKENAKLTEAKRLKTFLSSNSNEVFASIGVFPEVFGVPLLSMLPKPIRCLQQYQDKMCSCPPTEAYN